VTRILPYLGPAFVASVAYMDPGNYATNIQSGAQFGYTLLWVVLAANLAAMLVQTLSAKLGIATGRNLAELCRERFPRWLSYLFWIVEEIAAMATDLAEFLGAALGFYLLFHIPLFIAGLLTGVITFVILILERYGYRPIEAVITSLIGVIAVCYLIELVLQPPSLKRVGLAIMMPHFAGPEGVLLATGILGATVMPHVIYLHSALTQRRIVPRTPEEAQRIFHFEVLDVMIAMGIAGLVNAAMLMMASATFHDRGLSDVASIEQAYRTLEPLLGHFASVIFALSLLASGLSSSTVGTMAGQVVMQGFVHWSIPLWLRRGLTMLPALVVIGMGLDPTRTLVISQVVLSFALPVPLVTLVRFTSDPQVMGVLVNRRLTTAAAWLLTALIIGLNVFLLVSTFTGIG
jgi:manganese transport protein